MTATGDAAPARLAGVDLACRRGGRTVFAGLDFELLPGGALLLTGPNGAGKSSLLRLIAGLLAPAAGRLEWAGAELAEDPDAQRARIAYLGHGNGLKAQLSARENLRFWRRYAGARGPEAAIEAAIARFDLAALADRPVGGLSSGQQRRVALARVLASGAALWLLDEPTTGLDRDNQARLVAAVAAHRAGGGLLVCATHDGLDLPGAARLDLAAFAVTEQPAGAAARWAADWATDWAADRPGEDAAGPRPS